MSGSANIKSMFDMAMDNEFDDTDAECSDNDEESEDEVPSEADEVDASLADVEDTWASFEENNAEKEIENDFDRLVQNIRSRDITSNSGALAREWDISIEEQDAEFRDDLRAASGIGRRRRKRSRGDGPILSPEVKVLIGEANQAYIDCNLQETIRIMQEVIRIEPRAAQAWSVLAQCYEDMKQDQKALQLRIMAAHLRHDAEEWARLAKQSRDLKYNQQALYCYRKVLSLDPTNVHALWDRATLAKEVGDLKTARTAFLAILKRYPHDTTVLSELRTILIELGDLQLCTTLFQQALDHYQNTYPSGRGTDPSSGAVVAGGGFGLLEILVLADLCNTLGVHEAAIGFIRRGCRWLQGRIDQKYWDACDDDREYDAQDESGRGTVERTGDVVPGFYPLDVNARHRLAIARLKTGETDEGKYHANIVLSEDVLDYAPLFGEIADAYFEREMYTEARPIYELLGTDEATSSIYVLMQAAACLRMLGELKEAAEIYEHIRTADPTHNEAKMRLAEIYEILDEPRKALVLVHEVIDSRKKRLPDKSIREEGSQSANASQTSLFVEEKKGAKGRTMTRPQNKLTVAQLKELEAEREKELLRGYHRVKELWPTMVSGNGEEKENSKREWLVEAEKMIDMFRETRQLFLTSRSQPFRGMFPVHRMFKKNTEADAHRMASRLQLDIERNSLSSKTTGTNVKVDVFRGVSFKEWLRIFMQYAFLHTKNNEFELAEEILRHILLSNAYQSKDSQNTIRLALITCAIHARRYSVVVEQCRKIINVHQFNNEPMRLLMASLASGLRSTDAFISSTLQKHLFRELKIADTAVKNPELLKYHPVNKRYAWVTQSKSGEGDAPEEEVDDDVEGAPVDNEAGQENVGQPRIPTKFNPIIVTLYGQFCIASKSYQGAIFYLLHAYDDCPQDPMICLCLAIASIGRAMQRQADNRHHLIAQSMAFLTRYRRLRNTSLHTNQEVEYNFGRLFHQLGLYSHAVRHYKHALEIAEQQSSDESAVTRETAYNLSLIYVLTGATPLAEALYRRWLSF